MTTETMRKLHGTRESLARSCASHASKSERAKTNPFFVRRVYWLVLNGVCDSFEEVLTHADR